MPYNEDVKSMASIGMVPTGTKPSFLENIIGPVSKAVENYFDATEKKNKKEKDKIDMYVSLRKAGYPEKASFDAANKWSIEALSGVSGSGDLETEKTRAEIDLIKKKKDILSEPKNTQEAERQRIKVKIDEGIDLTPEEKKLYYGFTEKPEEEDLIPGMDTAISPQVKTEYTPPEWLQKIVGTWKKPGMTGEEPKPKVTPKETKIVKGVTYERGSDGKWHKR